MTKAIQNAVFWGWLGLGWSLVAVSDAASAIADVLFGDEDAA